MGELVLTVKCVILGVAKFKIRISKYCLKESMSITMPDKFDVTKLSSILAVCFANQTVYFR
jgi:hypothetical protein